MIMRVLSNIKPEAVFYYFEDICSIPHGSGNTKQISDYCVNFAIEHGLDCFTDNLNNVIIRKPASAGYELHPTVILQGHLDMVCEKLPDCDINFETDSLSIATDGDYIYAKGTTLGGDDGIAIAMILAILADNSIIHPEIEAVFTVDEETGMFGAEALDTSVLRGQTLINLDSEQMGVITVSCAGGARADLTVPLTRKKINSPCYQITVGGLIGGHSGTEINRGRLNANKLMGELLSNITVPYSIVSVDGGNKDNVIPRECRCVISTTENGKIGVNEFIESHKCDFEPNLTISVNPVEQHDSAFDYDSTRKLVEFINVLPNGVIRMSDDIDMLVQTSLNLGVLRSNETDINASFAVRSSVSSDKAELIRLLHDICNTFGGSFNEYGHYPAWEYRKQSRLRNTMVDVYTDMFGEKPQIEAIHAGLECGIFASRIKNFDAVSIGPNLYDIHTARERLSISSTKALYEYLIQVLIKL